MTTITSKKVMISQPKKKCEMPPSKQQACKLTLGTRVPQHLYPGLKLSRVISALDSMLASWVYVGYGGENIESTTIFLGNDRVVTVEAAPVDSAIGLSK